MVTKISTVLDERGKRYGDFADNAFVVQQIKDALRAGVEWNNMNWAQREALEMIAVKMSRIVSGDPNYKDSWTDIIGFATLIEKDMK